MATQLQDDGDLPPMERDFEAEARQQGWKPLDEFDGDPAKHKSAEQFVKDGEEKLSLSNARVKHLTQALETANRRSARLEKDFETVKGMMSNIEKRAYERALSDLKKEQRAAVESGDVQAFEQATERMEKLREDVAPAEVTKPATKYEPATVQRIYAQFVEENQWFDEAAGGGPKKAMTIEAALVADQLGQLDDYDGTPAEYFQEIADRVKEKFGERYPEMFGGKKADDEGDEPKPAKKKLSVEGVSSTRRGVERLRSATQAEREQAQRFVNMGVFPSMEVAIKEIVSHAG